MPRYLYIPNGSAGNLLVYSEDGSTHLETVSAPFAGADVVDVAVTLDGAKLFVAYESGIKVLDATDFSVLDDITGFSPKQVSLNDFGTYLYVAAGTDLIIKVDASSHAVTIIAPSGYTSIDTIAANNNQFYAFGSDAQSKLSCRFQSNDSERLSRSGCTVHQIEWGRNSSGEMLLAGVTDPGNGTGAFQILRYDPVTNTLLSAITTLGDSGWGVAVSSSRDYLFTNRFPSNGAATRGALGAGEYSPTLSAGTTDFINETTYGTLVNHGRMSSNGTYAALETASGKVLIYSGTGSFVGVISAIDPRWIRYLTTDYSTAPNPTSLTPTSGLTAGGTSVTITGEKFQASDTVTFGGSSANSVNVVNSTTITCTAPAHSAGAVDVRVTRPSDSSYGELLAAYTYYAAAPTITSFSPTSGPVGTLVTVSGTNLAGITSAKFFNNKTAGISSNTNTSAVLAVPAAATTGPISLTTPGGSVTSGSNFTVTTPVTAPSLGAETHITFKKTGNTFHTLGLPSLPTDATSWKLYTDAGSLIASNLAGNTDYDRTALTAGTLYGYKLKASNGSGDSAFSDPDFIVTNLLGGGVEVPDKPAAPTVSKSCALAKFTVTDSAWANNDTKPTTSSELRRSVNGGDPETLSPGWVAAAGTYNDTDVEAFDSAVYSVRHVNAAGASDWSDWSVAVALVSTTNLGVASPAAGTLSGTKSLRFTKSGPVTSPAVYWNGVNIGAPALRDGYYVIDWDTWKSAQGSGTLRFQAVGTDGCPCKTERNYTLANSAHDLVAYSQIIGRENVSPAGQRLRSAGFYFQAEPIPEAPSLRRRLQVRALLDDEAPNAAFAGAFDDETWAQGQPLLLVGGKTLENGTTQWGWNDILTKPSGEDAPAGRRAIFRFRWDVEEVLTGFSTYGEGSGSRIIKMRSGGAFDSDAYRILLLAVKDDLSSARIYSFDGMELEVLETGDGDPLNLEDAPFNAPAAFDFALAGDKVFVAAAADELFYVDMDAGEVSGNQIPRGETRNLVFLESIGANLFAIFSDNVSTPKSVCYRWNGSWKPMWTLNEVVTASGMRDEGQGMSLAAGAALYLTNGTSTPTLSHTFGANITALGERFVGLSNGKVMELVSDTWTERLDRSGAIEATAEFSGATHETDDPRGIAGEDSTTLLEATASPAVWSDARVLATPGLMEEAVDGVTALFRYLKQLTPATGTFGSPDYTPATYRELLLIGTAPDGLLLVLEASDIVNNPLAIPAAHIGRFRLLTVNEGVPDEA